jgi:hypothetical protein
MQINPAARCWRSHWPARPVVLLVAIVIVCFSVEGWIYVSCCLEAAASPVTGLSSLEIV